jgi:hypothetical protein
MTSEDSHVLNCVGCDGISQFVNQILGAPWNELAFDSRPHGGAPHR